MQARHTNVTPAIRGNTRKGVDTQNICTKGNHSKNIPASRTLGFVPVAFKNKPLRDVPFENYGDDKFSGAWEHLHSAYLNYCRLARVLPKSRLDNYPITDRIRIIHTHLQKLIHAVNPKATLNIEYDEETEKNFFIAYHGYYIGMDIYCFPLELLKYLEQYKSTLLEYAILFTHSLIRHLGLTSWKDGRMEFHLEMMLDHANCLLEDDGPEAAQVILDDLHSYTQGEANSWLNRVNKSSYIGPKHIKQLRTKRYKDKFQQFLKNWMIEGYDILKDRNCHPVQQFQFKIDPDNEGEREYIHSFGDGVSIDNLFMLCWSDDDSIINSHIESINVEYGELGVYEPYEWHIIDENTLSVYEHSEWFITMTEWLSKGLKEIFHYCDCKRKIQFNNERHDQAANREL